MRKSGLADSPFFKAPPVDVPSARRIFAPEKLGSEDKGVMQNKLTPGVPDSVSTEVRESGSHGLPELQTYGVYRYDQLRRLDLRVTGDQKRFLDTWEEDLNQTMPERERYNPNTQRITKNSIIRVLIEIARQYGLAVDASGIRNEADLLKAIDQALKDKLTDFRSQGVTD